MATMSQQEKGALFAALHARDRAFLIPNPYDIGTARLLAYLGFEALATTSAGYAFTVGRKDGKIGREESIAHAKAIATATHLPVSADLENGFGDSPEDAAETIRSGAEAGIVGASIEDARSDRSVYEIPHAADRIRAAAEAARALPFQFTLTARAENFIVGRPDLKDTIARLQAYQEAGADVLFAPGLRTRQDIETVVRSVDRPVNVIMALQGVALSVDDVSAIGVKRISIGSSLSRVALGAFLRAAREMKDHGTFQFAEETIPYQDLGKIFD